VNQRSAATWFAFERSAAAAPFEIHLETSGMVDEAIDDDGHDLVREDLAHSPRG